MKVFNTTGLCMPNEHYMVDLSQRVQRINESLISRGAYFAINRARQYGKTTTLGAMERALADDHVVISISFEGFGSTSPL